MCYAGVLGAYMTIYQRVAARSQQENAVQLFSDAFSLYLSRNFEKAAAYFQTYLTNCNHADKAAQVCWNHGLHLRRL